MKNREDHAKVQGTIEQSPEKRLAADLLVDDDREKQPDGHRQGNPHGGVIDDVTFPLLRPGHFFVATVGVIGALQLFDQAYIAGGSEGAPVNSLMTIVLYLYSALFKRLDPGYAGAVGIVLFLIIFSATLLQRRLFGSAPSW